MFILNLRLMKKLLAAMFVFIALGVYSCDNYESDEIYREQSQSAIDRDSIKPPPGG